MKRRAGLALLTVSTLIGLSACSAGGTPSSPSGSPSADHAASVETMKRELGALPGVSDVSVSYADQPGSFTAAQVAASLQCPDCTRDALVALADRAFPIIVRSLPADTDPGTGISLRVASISSEAGAKDVGLDSALPTLQDVRRHYGL